jgi:hypothetical protein
MPSNKDKSVPLNTFQYLRIHRSSTSAVNKITAPLKGRLHDPQFADPIPKSQLVDLGAPCRIWDAVQPVDLSLLTVICRLGNKSGEITRCDLICVTRL